MLKSNNLEEINKFLENSKQPKLSQDEVESLNKPKIEFVIKTIKKDTSKPRWIHWRILQNIWRINFYYFWKY